MMACFDPAIEDQLVEQLEVAANISDEALVHFPLENFSPIVLNDALCCACEKGLLGVVNRLLQETRIDPSADMNWPIRSACAKGHLLVVERLLEDERVNPAADNNSAINLASQNGHLPVVERLLKDDCRLKGVDPASLRNSPIGLASQNGHLSVVERLLEVDCRLRGVNPAADDYWAIRKAVENKHLAVVARLLREVPTFISELKQNYPIVFHALVQEYFNVMYYHFPILEKWLLELPKDVVNIVGAHVVDFNPVGQAINLGVAYERHKEKQQNAMVQEQSMMEDEPKGACLNRKREDNSIS